MKGPVDHGRPIDIDDMEPVDLVVCGTVAVNRRGVRVGGGYSDLELALLAGGRVHGSAHHPGYHGASPGPR